MKFTIFTPTYNRRNLLKNLYKSLQKQTYKDFEWLIVDDGSTDNTKEVVEEFLGEKKIDIKYFYKENGGKQRAYNFAMTKAKGELFICLDSDDEYVENGLYTIVKYWDKFCSQGIVEKEKIAGIGYLSTYPNGEIIGSQFPKDITISTQFDIYEKYKVSGDKGLMFITDIIKKYPFPVFEDEKFITEAVVYNRLCMEYNMIYINEKIEIKEYQEDGLTSKYNNLLIKNPKGQALYHNERNKYKMPLLKKIINNALYYKFCKIAKYPFSKMIKENKSKLFFILSLPIGIYMVIKNKKNIS